MTRAEEQAAIDAIATKLCAELGIDPKITYEPNGFGTAPDFQLEIGPRKISLEVRRSGNGFLHSSDSEETVKCREGCEGACLTDMELKLNNLIKKWIDPQYTIILTLLSPIPTRKRSALAEAINKKLKKFFSVNSIDLDQNKSFSIPTYDKNNHSIEFEAKLTDYYANKSVYSPIKSIHACATQSPNLALQNDLVLQAGYILRVAIEGKAKKMSLVLGEKWLALVNTHPILTPDLYQRAIDQSHIDNTHHSFTKIFIIYGTSAIELIVLQKI